MDDERSPNEPESNLDWTPGECLRTAAESADRNDVDACIAVMLRRRPEQGGNSYDVQCLISGLTVSEAIALLEIEKARLLRNFTDPDDALSD